MPSCSGRDVLRPLQPLYVFPFPPPFRIYNPTTHYFMLQQCEFILRVCMGHSRSLAEIEQDLGHLTGFPFSSLPFYALFFWLALPLTISFFSYRSLLQAKRLSRSRDNSITFLRANTYKSTHCTTDHTRFQLLLRPVFLFPFLFYPRAGVRGCEGIGVVLLQGMRGKGAPLWTGSHAF